MHTINYIRKRNRIVKYLFLLSGIFVLLFISSFGREENVAEKDLENNKLSNLPKSFNLSINNSIFEGVNKDKLPYKIMASEVTKQYDNIYNLSTINANYNISKGNLKILAENGVLDETTKFLILSNNVKVIFNDFILTGNKINLNLNSNSASSDSPVEVIFQNSKINASTFNADDSSNMINFEGNVISTFDLNDF